MADLAAPVRVSPFIRGCRYLALFSGVTYGLLRYKYLKRKETKIRAYETKQREMREAKMAEEKKIANRNEMLYLAKECNVQVPPNF